MCDTHLKKVDTYTLVKCDNTEVKFCYGDYINLCRERGIEPVSCRTPCSCGGYGCSNDCSEGEDTYDSEVVECFECETKNTDEMLKDNNNKCAGCDKEIDHWGNAVDE